MHDATTDTHDGRTVIAPTTGGAGRLGERMLPRIQETNATGEVVIVPRYVDIQGGKAERLARSARRMGIPATGEDGLIEDVVLDPEALGEPVWNTTDHPSVHADVLRLTATSGQPVVGSLFSRLATTGELWGLRYGFESADATGKLALARLLEELAPLTPRADAADVLEGEWHDGGIFEGPIRSWLADHMVDTFERFAAGRPLKYHPAELTTDAGATTLPLTVVDEGGLADPLALAGRFYDAPPFPVFRSRDYMIAELAPRIVRFSRVRLRRLDHRIAVRQTTTVPTAIAFDQRPSDRRVISRTSPMLTTD